MTTTRVERKTASAMLWVTKTMVVRVSRQMFSNSPFSRSRVISSSAPNGSSISRIAGLEGQGAGDADPLLHAAGQLPGVVLLELAQAHQVEQARWRASGARPAATCMISSGSSTFLITVRQS